MRFFSISNSILLFWRLISRASNIIKSGEDARFPSSPDFGHVFISLPLLIVNTLQIYSFSIIKRKNEDKKYTDDQACFR